MVKLTKIRRDKNLVFCVAQFEGHDSKVPLKLDLETGSFDKVEISEEYVNSPMHMSQIKWYLLRHADALPEERLLMWY